jgi:predicted dehydrogenase
LSKKNHLEIGVIGSGYWGPNLIRNFNSLPNCTVKTVADKKQGRLDFIRQEFPSTEVTLDYLDIINDNSIDAVCIATPVKTHTNIAIEAMKAGKHVFVEKPMAANPAEAEEIREAAKKYNKKLAVGHVFQFAPAVRAIKRLIEDNVIGDIFHITSTRINLGPPETDIDVVWDLGPHDFSILLYLLNEFPLEVNSYNSYFPYGFSADDKTKLTNNSDIQLSFHSGITAHIHLSWLSSNKTRLMQIFGSEGTIVYDEMLALDGKVKLYGKGVDNRINSKGNDAKQLSYQSGDIHIISLEQHEPLRMECEHFVDSIINDTYLINNGQIGLEVVKLISLSLSK